MIFLKYLLLVVIGCSFYIQAHAAGSCTANAKCSNGTASCSVNSKNTGNSGKRYEVFCGEMNSGDKFLSCWNETKGIKSVEDVICCDKNGNAMHGGWSVDSVANTSGCVGY
jgi:hypothetical protein